MTLPPALPVGPSWLLSRNVDLQPLDIDKRERHRHRLAIRLNMLNCLTPAPFLSQAMLGISGPRDGTNLGHSRSPALFFFFNLQPQMPRILLVEDDREVGRMLEHVLLRARYEVDVASGVIEGIRLLGRHRYDLVIADARLPDGIGMQVADLAAEKGMKSLILTGYAFSYPELRNYNYLLKPLRSHELLEEVERLLGTSGPAP